MKSQAAVQGTGVSEPTIDFLKLFIIVRGQQICCLHDRSNWPD